MKNIIYRSSAAFIAVSMIATAAPASAEALNDAIAMAYAQNPTLARARAQQRANDENYVQSRSQFGPSLSIGLTQSYNDRAQDFFGDRSFQSAGLSVTQSIFTTGGITATLEASKAGVKSGQQNLRSVEQQIVLQVISSYTAVRRDQEALRISQENYDILQKQLEQTTAQFNAGELTKTDVAEAQARLAASRASLASAQAQLEADRANYIAVVGQAPTALEPTPVLPAMPDDFNHAVDVALANNPDLASAKYADDEAVARIKEARAAFGPTVGLNGSISKSNVAGQLSKANADASATIQVSIPLFSSGLNGSRLRQTLDQESEAQFTVEQTRRSVVATVSQAWSNMLAATAAVTSNQQQVSAATIAAEGVKTEEQAGLRTTIEVLNAQEELKAAQLALVDAQRAAYLAGAQVLAATGQLTAQAFVPDIKVYNPEVHFRSVANMGWTPIVPIVHALDKAGEALVSKSK